MIYAWSSFSSSAFLPHSPSPPVGISLSSSDSNPSAALAARHPLLEYHLSIGDARIRLFYIILSLQPQACVCTCPLARGRNVFPRACACSMCGPLSSPSFSRPHTSCLLGLCRLQDSHQSCLRLGNPRGKEMGLCEGEGEPTGVRSRGGRVRGAGWQTCPCVSALMLPLCRTQLNVKISP